MVDTIGDTAAVSGAPSYNGRMLRQTRGVYMGGATAARPLGARSGVRPGTSPTTVTVTSTTWSCGAFAGLADVEAAGEAGGYPFSFDAALTAQPLNAASASFPGSDLIVVQVDDPSEDGTTVPAVRRLYVPGTAAVGAPDPALPARSFAIARINRPIVGGGSPTVTWLNRYAVSAGGILPVPTGSYPSSPHIGEYVDDAALGLMRYTESGWQRYSPVEVPVTPTSVLGTGTSLNADGSISFSAATSVAVINAFDASAEKFMIDVFLDTKTASTDTLFQFLNAGGGSVTSGYVGETILAASGSINAVAQNPNGWYFDKGQTSPMSTLMTIFRPFQAGPKTAHTDSSSGTGLSVKGLGGHAFSGSSSFSSFQLSVVSGTISGKMWITKVVR